jgi:hypothetical protein
VSYITRDELKQHLGIDASEVSDDALLDVLITRTQAVVDEFCHRTFEASADTTRTFDAEADVSDDGYTLLIDRDLASITSVTNGDSTTVTSSEYVTEPRNDAPYYALTIRSDASVVWTYTDYPENAISIVGRWAYSTTAPNNIKQAMLLLCAWFYRQKDTTADIDRPLLAGDGTVILPQTLPASVMSLLKPYRRPF